MPLHPYLTDHSEPPSHRLNAIPAAFFRNAADMTFTDLAYVVANVLLGDSVSGASLKRLIDRSLTDVAHHSPEAEAAFVAECCRHSLGPDEQVVVCASEAADVYLFEELRRRHANVVMLAPRSFLLPPAADIIEVQGSAEQCARLAVDLAPDVNVCSTHNAAARAVRVAVVIYKALTSAPEPGQPFTVHSESMARAVATARALGLPLEAEVAVAPPHREFCPAITRSASQPKAPHRVAPVASAVRQALARVEASRSNKP